jgi:hypothetical protein
MDREECAGADWRLIGYEDGTRGLPASRIGQHRGACADHGLSPDLDTYLAGRREGLKVYCTRDNGFDLGVRGKSIAAVCPEETASAFRSEHARGRDLYLARAKVRKLGRRIGDAKASVADNEEQIERLETQLIADDISMKRRMEIVLEIRRLVAESDDLDGRIADLEHERRQARYRLDDLQARAP